MSEILVKGVDMPKGCDGCFCIAYNPISDKFFCNLTLETMKNSYAEEKPKWCPLREVQTHGDLKDWEKIKEIFNKYLPNVDDDTNELLCTIMVDIGMNAPTVLEETKRGKK